MSMIQNNLWSQQVSSDYRSIASMIEMICENNGLIDQILEEKKDANIHAPAMVQILKELRVNNLGYESKLAAWGRELIQINDKQDHPSSKRKESIYKRVAQVNDYLIKQKRQLALAKSAISV